MVRNMVQKALPVIALMSVVVTARYAIAETGLQCYNRLGCGSAGGRFACYGCCDACGKAAVNCQEACDGNPLPCYGPDTYDNHFPPVDGGGDTDAVS